MAGSVKITRQHVRARTQSRYVEKVRVDWVGDAGDGSVPNTVIPSLCGYVFKAVTIPGAPNPTANYNVNLFDPDAPTFSTLIGKLNSRSASAVEEVYIIPTGGVAPVVVAGDYTFSISGNSVLGAKGTVIFYIQETF